MKPTLFVADEIENFRFAPDAPNISIDMSPIVVYHILTLECACYVNFCVAIRAATDPADPDPDPDLLTTRIQNSRSVSVKKICLLNLLQILGT